MRDAGPCKVRQRLPTGGRWGWRKAAPETCAMIDVGHGETPESERYARAEGHPVAHDTDAWSDVASFSAARRMTLHACRFLEQAMSYPAALQSYRTFAIHHWQCSWCRQDASAARGSHGVCLQCRNEGQVACHGASRVSLSAFVQQCLSASVCVCLRRSAFVFVCLRLSTPVSVSVSWFVYLHVSVSVR